MEQVVIGIVEHHGNFIFLHRLNGYWTFPSGKVDDSDVSLNSAVEREVLEESGVICKADAYLGTREVNNKELHYIACDYISGDIRLTEEDKFDVIGWKSAEEIMTIVGSDIFPAVERYMADKRNSNNEESLTLSIK
jgi:8-oxo-dGTP pyrophosphatase MutT (NUDIX family)